MRLPLVTVVETATFIGDADRLFRDPERVRLVCFLANNPQVGEIIPETGGVRKLRWALSGGGKRGGARVIYYFHNESLPLFLLAAYGKNEKANLSGAERNAMAKLVPVLIEYSNNRGRKS